MLALLPSLPYPSALCLIGLALGPASEATADQAAPALFGYGVHSCERFVAAAAGADEGRATDVAAYQRYRQWLSGFVSGLNLATGTDVLRGTPVEAVLGRIESECGERPEADFFNTTMGFIGVLMQLNPPAPTAPGRSSSAQGR